MYRIILSLCLTFIFLSFSDCAVRIGQNSHNATESRNVSEAHLTPSAIVVESRNGSVEVVADSSVSSVQISATIRCVGETDEEAKSRLAGTTLSVERGTDRVLTIKPVFAGGPRGNDSASIVVKLPDATGATINTSNGTGRAKGLAGKLTISTSNAEVDVIGHRGNAHLESSNGQIHVENLAGNLEAETSNAAVNVTSLSGAAVVTTSNGSITLSLVDDQPGPIELTTSNASIDVHVGSAFVGEVTLDTSNAGVTVVDSLNRVTHRQLEKHGGSIRVGQGGKPSTINTSNGKIQFTIGGK